MTKEFNDDLSEGLSSQAGEPPFLNDESWLTQPKEKSFQRRWYDHVGELNSAIEEAQNLPESIQKLLAVNLHSTISQTRRKTKNTGDTLSLGSSTVLGLYQSGLKRRWYDESAPQFSRALTMMSTMPESFLTHYADRMLDISQYFHAYEQESILPSQQIDRTIEAILSDSYTKLEDKKSDIRIKNNKPLDINNLSQHIVKTKKEIKVLVKFYIKQ